MRKAPPKNTTRATLTQEFEYREFSRARLQVEPGKPDTMNDDAYGFGIFGSQSTSVERFVTGVDNEDVKLFDSRDVSTSFEDETLEAHRISSSLDVQESLYSSLQTELTNLVPAMRRIFELKETAVIDFQQVSNEALLLETEQLGPPRRLPSSNEIAATHMRKQRLHDLSELISSYQKSLESLEVKRGAMEKQMLSIAKALALLREKNKNANTSLIISNHGLGQLPVVVGHGIAPIKENSKEGGNGMENHPKEAFDAIVKKSKFVFVKEEEEKLLALHQIRGVADQVL